MPKIHLECSQEWWNRLQTNVNATIDACVGLTAQINNHQINGVHDAEQLLDRIEGELRQIRKMMEAVAVPF